MNKLPLIIPTFLFLLLSCQNNLQEKKIKTTIAQWVPYDESDEIAANADNESIRLRYKLIQPKVNDKNEIWENVAGQINDFSEEDYERLKPLILEQDIPSMQKRVSSGELSYENIVKWYLYRIVKFENDSTKTLHTVISINPNAVAEARKKDKTKSEGDHLLFGMPILLKDNINFEGLPTTAGAHALLNNNAADAFIVSKLKDKGGIILGKLSLSEWANYLCVGCPNGFSAVGGQTLNPYGRRKFDTGGSSSGSGTAMAANYAAAAVGTETSGSILSPSSSNSIVGLKPTVGLLSRRGIVPISSTLDTPGPMTRNVTDNAILLSALVGKDPEDVATEKAPKSNENYLSDLTPGGLEGKRFGVIKDFLEDSLYQLSVKKIESLGGVLVEYEAEQIALDGFLSLLNGDMKMDLAYYLTNYASDEIEVASVEEVVNYNLIDSAIRIPYGQGRLEGILADTISPEGLIGVRKSLNERGVKYFEKPMREHNLDAILSINNWSAGYAAVAKYPCITVPMGYQETGQPMGITFIARPFEEDKLLKLAYAYELATKKRELAKQFE